MYQSRFESSKVDALFDVILALQTREDCYRFFEDLCTIQEITDMSQRLEVAKRLLRGETYQQITDKMEISTATISRINRCLRYGAQGYLRALKKERE